MGSLEELSLDQGNLYILYGVISVYIFVRQCDFAGRETLETEELGSFDVMPQPQKRVIGPSVPPPELLRQAAEVADAVSLYTMSICLHIFMLVLSSSI